ncbi:MAG: sugar phosphate isomerase/epimerase [Candidatus Methanoplasma sp.]|jgi:sugar phosphate isomerase/epimerase|nr:sugar phosphate isomerase/epimerase [Candidatus Methanoplasma sp.]
MKHLYNYSVYQPLTDIPGSGDDPVLRLNAIGCDGLELFTLYDKIDDCYRGIAPAVHLPFAIDWYRGWEERADIEEFNEISVRPVLFGRDRAEIVDNIRRFITVAADIDPAYGVLHAGNSNIDDVMLRTLHDDDRKVLDAFVEMVNTVVSGFPGGEPPFRLAFENLWGSGLKMIRKWEFELFERKLEFDNWGFCLDTGHMMNTLPDAYTEEQAINGLLHIFDGYSESIKDRIGTMHFHVSTSAEYRNTFPEEERPAWETMQETITRSYPHIMKIDQHRPFSDPRCVELVDAISPDFVTHEMIGSGSGDAITDLKQQLAHFNSDSV